jgi:hypothetical protein
VVDSCEHGFGTPGFKAGGRTNTSTTLSSLRPIKHILIKSPKCPCNGGHQTVDHLIYDCNKLQSERKKLINSVSKQDNWPVNKSDLVNKYIKQFTQFANSIDFEKL